MCVLLYVLELFRCFYEDVVIVKVKFLTDFLQKLTQSRHVEVINLLKKELHAFLDDLDGNCVFQIEVSNKFNVAEFSFSYSRCVFIFVNPKRVSHRCLLWTVKLFLAFL
jgi:hypothetical protein